MAQIIIPDTNILLVKSEFELYYSLRARRNGHLTLNSDLDKKALEEAVTAGQRARGYFDHKLEAQIVPGVAKQTIAYIDDMIESITKRSREYFFAALDGTMSTKERNDQSANTECMAKYLPILKEKKKFVQEHTIDYPADAGYVAVQHFVDDVQRHYGLQACQNPDGGADDSIVTWALYSAMKKKSTLVVYTNDRGIAELLSVSRELLKLGKPFLTQNSAFYNFTDSTIMLKKWAFPKSAEEWNGQETIRNKLYAHAGLDVPLQDAPDGERIMYRRAVDKFVMVIKPQIEDIFNRMKASK